MKVLKFTLIFFILFCSCWEVIYGKAPESAGYPREDTLLFPSLVYAPVFAPAGSSPPNGIYFVKGTESFERSPLTPAIKDDPENKAPKAHAGNYKDQKDEDGNGKESVQLDGSKSEDKDGRIVSYSWTIEGTDTELATGVNPVVEFPVGSTWIVLTVTDDGGLTDSEKVKIKVKEGEGNIGGDDEDDDDDDEEEDEDDEEDDEEEEEDEPNNSGPVADAGADQQLIDTDKDGKEDVVLDGSNSKDEDGSIVTYSWSVEGTKIAEGQNPTVSLGTGTHIVQLTVTDNGGLTESDETEIRIKTPTNKAPKAKAGADQELTDTDGNGLESVELDGSGSKDPDGKIEGFSWEVNGAEIATGEKPVVELPTGTTTVVLRVTDNDGATDTDEVRITIKEAPNEAPVAHAGENQMLTEEEGAGATDVKLNGSGSTDPDGEIVSYSWTLAGTEIATGREPVVSLATGDHTLTLTVTDNDGATDTDEVEIKISIRENEEEEEEEKPANKAPVAHAGADQELTDTDGNGKETVQLDGSGSTDEDGSITSYSWSLEGSETILATEVTPAIELSPGTATIVLKVTDDGASTNTDTVEILIKERAEIPEETGGGEGTAFLPNLFSPNGDQMNDEFTLEATQVERVHWRIYNRQGRLVYETQDVVQAIKFGWDGNAFGEAQPAGTYVWILEGSYTDGSPILIDGNIKGNVTLIR